MDLEQLKYPIGKFKYVGFTDEYWQQSIDSIENLPAKLNDAVRNLSESQLDTPYRAEGWTVRQLVHHIADSHMNAYIRFKLALTEDSPIIKPYEEQLWAELPDSKLPIHHSLELIKALHYRWTTLLKTLKKEDFDKVFVHPANIRPMALNFVLGLYAWHSMHHTAHITELIKRENW
jgi:uncharacterized damage-inducible protein DinB